MKVSSIISNVTKPIRKTIVGAMIACPVAGTMQSCDTLVLNMRHAPVERPMHFRPPVAPPPARSFVQPQQPPRQVNPPRTHTNNHGDRVEINRGGRR